MAAIPRELVDGVFELILALTGEVPIALSCFVIPCLAYRLRCWSGRRRQRRCSVVVRCLRSPCRRQATTATLIFAVVVLVVCPVCTVHPPTTSTTASSSPVDAIPLSIPVAPGAAEQ